MILVTGATGHIGNVLIRELLQNGEKVRAMVLPKDDLTPIKYLDVEIVIGDVLEQDSLVRAMRGVDTVYHLAGLISIMPGDADLLQQINVDGTRNMLSAARENQVKRFVYTSSIHALTRQPHGSIMSESANFDPGQAVGDYDRSKAQASLEVIQAAQQGMDTVIVCPTGVIGPFDYKLSELGTLLFKALTQKTTYSIAGAYDFVDVRDVARGEILAGKYGRRGEAYILSGEWIRIRDILAFVKEISGEKGSLIQIPTWLAKAASRITPAYYRLTKSKPQFTSYSIETVQSNAVVSHQKATQELGYHPRRIKESLTDTVQWLLENRKLKQELISRNIK
ncbi:MAG: epimerase [Anaerolinea sp.]|nr:epimerase [Anaerolinea sp.]